ncbi:hypothetical protein RND81_07G111600 [Saponaria officinalis]|uniref:non-specific serine/threonine protein kinase n=1 Tax=Saponaria officinalis TaxID=3572 RepID=A0AAW1JQ28_SAPOF
MSSGCPRLKSFIYLLSLAPFILSTGVFASEAVSEVGRKLLLRGIKEEARFPAAHSDEDMNGGYDPFSSKIVAMGLPGMLLLGCMFICPCFQPKRKDIHVTDSSRDLNLMDSSSSREVSLKSGKVAASQWRNLPPSPRYPPPSPNTSRHPPSSSQYPMSPNLDRFGSAHLNFSQISKATNNFSSSYKIGESGFGTVYKAQLPGGQWIAVKRAKKESFDFAEFNSEIDILSKVEHRCLVKLIGYVDKGKERLVITEYVSNGTLKEYLDGQRNKILDFSQRLQIAIDVAHGLAYLHLYAEKQIMHRDVKSSNILLTDNFKAKVADFGLARVGPVDSDHTHISTQVKGTVGYLDPEYMKTYKLTPKSDVYSFGILLLEILTGRRPVESNRPVTERVTIRWAVDNFNEGNVLSLLDPLMKESVDEEILKKIFCVAFQCSAPVRADRPDMKTVGEQLWAIRLDFHSTKRS